MKKRTIKNILLFFAVFVVLASTTGYFLWNKPHKNILATEAIETNAIILYNTFVTDSIKAKKTYVNKVLSITGIVKSVSVNQQHQQIILLKTSEPDASVNCTMETNAIGIKIGGEVLIKGLCIGYINGETDIGLPGDVFLVRCYYSI